MEALRQNLPDEAPGIQQMRTQISALQEQLLVEKNRSTLGKDGKSAAEVINEFGKRQLETEFASKDYLSALTALESARITANRQNRYLEPFNLPNLPDKPALPRRLYSIVTVLAVCLLLWGGWTLFIAGVKEHQY
jgi:capsule polysaccharide export protein KpsE/RkpR